MKKNKRFLQKTATISGKLSFITAGISAIFLYLKTQELGMNDAISASFLAGVFFFTFVGALLLFIGNADIPSFKVGED